MTGQLFLASVSSIGPSRVRIRKRIRPARCQPRRGGNRPGNANRVTIPTTLQLRNVRRSNKACCNNDRGVGVCPDGSAPLLIADMLVLQRRCWNPTLAILVRSRHPSRMARCGHIAIAATFRSRSSEGRVTPQHSSEPGDSSAASTVRVDPTEGMARSIRG